MISLTLLVPLVSLVDRYRIYLSMSKEQRYHFIFLYGYLSRIIFKYCQLHIFNDSLAVYS